MRRGVLTVALALIAGTLVWGQGGGTALPTGSSNPLLSLGSPTGGVNSIGGDFASLEGETALGPTLVGALDTPEGRAALAMTTPEYPVTPGDVYTLSFITSSGAIVSSILVDSDLRVDLANLGKIDARGMRFAELRLLVEKKVLAAYPLSAPQLLVKSCGLFPVYLKGEVKKEGFVYSWGLARLSELWGKAQTALASSRQVTLVSREGKSSNFDLFRVWREGDKTQDPYLRPSDTIIFSRYTRSVSLTGAVSRPGTYQLLSGEGLKVLIEIYGEGLLPTARGDYSSLARKASGTSPTGEAIFFDAGMVGSGKNIPELQDGDAAYVPTREAYLPVIYFEGAIAAGTEAAKQYSTDRQPFKPGDKLSRALRSVATRIAPGADLRRAFIARKGSTETIPVDLERILYAYSPELDVELKAEDRIVIPYGSLDVFVTGEVTKSAWVNTAALTRLSLAVAPLLTKYSSVRDIAVRTAGGEEKRYDLFRAERYGELAQDPFLKPGDTVTVEKLKRAVTIGGEVRRPGTYQLLPGEGMQELVDVYAEGLLPTARGDYSSLSRRASGTSPEGEAIFFDASDVGTGLELPELQDGDAAYVPTREAYLPVIYFEGAIAAGTEAAKQYSTDRQPFKPGDKLSRALRAVAARIAPGADLRRAFIARKGSVETIPIDLERILYAYSPELDVELKAEDRIVIPYGSLDVFVTGEVTKSAWVNTAALTRLSLAVAPLLTKYSSVRDIAVRTAGGEEKRYDLFRAERYGELAQDPFLKPGDTVTVEKLKRAVTIGGEVRRPGTYQLLPGEGLKDLVEVYAAGFTEQANVQRMSLTRVNPGASGLGAKAMLDWGKDSGFWLLDSDSVAVASLKEILPVAYFEGALGVGINGEDPAAARRFPYTFYPGESLSQAVQALRKQFSAVSNLAEAYVIRGSERTPVDIGKFLYEKDYTNDMSLAAGDVVIVPFRQFFVSVSGAVKVPGRYPYVPDRSWEYYVNLAGGFDKDKNSGDALKIFDLKGLNHPKARIIEPEDTIVAASNSFLYSFQKVSAVLTTAISIAALVLSLLK